MKLRRITDKIIHSLAPDALRPSTIFRGGEGVSPWHITCDNPYDLGPPADMITRAITETQTKMVNENDSRPLVVLFGESHDTASHRSLQKSVMNRLLGQNMDFSVRMEHPHNHWADSITTNAHYLSVSPDLYYHCADYDPEGRAVLSASLAFNMSHFAPASSADHFAFCLHNNISTSFNDAARNGLLFDFLDPATLKAACDLDIPIDHLPVIAVNEDGIALRNHFMATRPFEKKLILQNAGSAHLFGQVEGTFEDSRKNLAFKDSLTAAYERAGAKVLSVYPTIRYNQGGLNTMPRKAYNHLKNSSVIIDGLAENRFFSEFFAEEHSYDFTLGVEELFISNVLHDSTSPVKWDFTDVSSSVPFYRILAKTEAYMLLSRYHFLRGFSPGP